MVATNILDLRHLSTAVFCCSSCMMASLLLSLAPLWCPTWMLISLTCLLLLTRLAGKQSGRKHWTRKTNRKQQRQRQQLPRFVTANLLSCGSSGASCLEGTGWGLDRQCRSTLIAPDLGSQAFWIIVLNTLYGSLCSVQSLGVALAASTATCSSIVHRGLKLGVVVGMHAFYSACCLHLASICRLV